MMVLEHKRKVEVREGKKGKEKERWRGEYKDPGEDSQHVLCKQTQPLQNRPHQPKLVGQQPETLTQPQISALQRH